MYLVEKLYELISHDPFSAEGTIAHNLIRHFQDLSFPGVLGFCRESGISRATLHRFVQEAGFSSWKDMILSLEDDLKRSRMPLPLNSEVKDFAALRKSRKLFLSSLQSAGRIFIFGDLSWFYCLFPLMIQLRNTGKEVFILNSWSESKNRQILEISGQLDVLILFDLNMRTDTFLEFSSNRPYMPNPLWLETLSLRKFHIGIKNSRFDSLFLPVHIDCPKQFTEADLTAFFAGLSREPDLFLPSNTTGTDINEI